MTSPEFFRPPALTPKDRAAFARDGVLKIARAVSPEEVALLRSAVDAQVASYGESLTAYDFQDIGRQIFADRGPIEVNGATRFDMEYFRDMVRADPKARPLLDSPSDPATPVGRFFYEAAGWRRFDEIRRVAMDSSLPTLCADLLQSRYLNFWEDTTFVKTSGAVQRTAFHQDKAYFQISGDKCVIVWIALDAADEETGALEYVRGSHLWGAEFAPNVFFAQTPFAHSDAAPLPDIEGDRAAYDILRIDAEPGDVIIHHVLTVHGAGGNRSATRQRRAISFRYCGDDVLYHDRPGAIPQPWVRTPLAEGAPLYSRDYPRVWPAPFPGARLSQLYRDA